MHLYHRYDPRVRLPLQDSDHRQQLSRQELTPPQVRRWPVPGELPCHHWRWLPIQVSTILSRSLSINTNEVKLQIWDTAGQERFRTITSAYYKGAHGIIMVYDLTSDQSFRDIQEFWAGEVKLHPFRLKNLRRRMWSWLLPATRQTNSKASSTMPRFWSTVQQRASIIWMWVLNQGIMWMQSSGILPKNWQRSTQRQRRKRPHRVRWCRRWCKRRTSSNWRPVQCRRSPRIRNAVDMVIVMHSTRWITLHIIYKSSFSTCFNLVDLPVISYFI